MKNILYGIIVFSCIQCAHAETKELANKTLEYVKKIKEQACNKKDSLNLDQNALPFLQKLSDNKEFQAEVCSPNEKHSQCIKSELPQSFHLELNAVIAGIAAYSASNAPTPPSYRKACCEASKNVEKYLEAYLGKSS